MMFEVEVAADQVTPAFERLEDLLDDLSPVMVEIGEYITQATKNRFRTSTGPDGNQWAAKSQTTLMNYGIRKSNRVPVKPLIGLTRNLSKNIFFDATSDSVEIGSPEIYSAVMQFGAAKGAFGTTSRGAPIPWGNIPARPFLGVSNDDQDEIIDIVEDWVSKVSQATP